MLTQDEYEKFIGLFMEDDAHAVLHLLQYLRRNPSGDIRLLSYIEDCLADNRISALSVPLTYGMIKWQAAQTLRVEYKACNVMKPIVVDSVFHPVTGINVSTLRLRAKICNDLNDIECIESLIKAGHIKLITIEYPAGV